MYNPVHAGTEFDHIMVLLSCLFLLTKTKMYDFLSDDPVKAYKRKRENDRKKAIYAKQMRNKKMDPIDINEGKGETYCKKQIINTQLFRNCRGHQTLLYFELSIKLVLDYNLKIH